jgi:hypothetical protein
MGAPGRVHLLNGLMESVCERGNLWPAYELVVGNKALLASLVSTDWVQSPPSAVVVAD